jgi:hypothetical protein
MVKETPKNIAALILMFLVFVFCSAAYAASVATGLERVLVEQEVVLANQKMTLKVSLATRNLWQQQGLNLIIDIATDKAMSSLSAQLLMPPAQPWQGLSVMSEAEQQRIDGVSHYRWRAIVFPKQLGVQELPAFRLRLEGASGSQKTISLPSLSVYVRSLPVFVPAEAWLGFADAPPVAKANPAWVLVGDQQLKTWQWRVQGFWEKGVSLPALSGKGAMGLQPWLDVQHEWVGGQYWTVIRAQQPWTATEMGRWQINAQDFWLFDGQTGKVQHWQLAGDAGFAVARWVWHGFLLLASLLLLLGVIVLLRLMVCRVCHHRYRQSIARAADAKQLLRVLALHWKLSPDIPLAHQAQGLPIEAELIALEGLLFSDHILHGTAFKAIRGQLLTRDCRQVC